MKSLIFCPCGRRCFAEPSPLGKGEERSLSRRPDFYLRRRALRLSLQTAKGMSRLQSGLIAYLDSVKSRDPAARSRWDILFYPGAIALGLHRFAHWLWEGRLSFIARLI